MSKKVATLTDLIARWRPAPWLFVREELGATPDPWQDVILHAVVGQHVDGTPFPEGQAYAQIALKACKGPGKTCVEAWLAWWFLLCFEDANILATSITGENLRDNLWKEMALWQAKSEILKAAFEWQTTRIYLRERPETWWMSARTWPKDADQTKQADSLAGLHARHTMLIVDESGDIPKGVLVAGLAHHSTEDVPGQKSKSGDQVHITLQCGNPTSMDGSLGFACIEDRKNWFVYEITGDPADPLRAPRMSLEWCQKQIDTWEPGATAATVTNPWLRVNVFGMFPITQDNRLLGPEQVRAAMRHCVVQSALRGEPKIMALDVARSLAADQSVLCRREGPVVYPFLKYRLDDAMQLAGQIAWEWSRWPAVVIFVDVVGIGGPVLDRLRELGLPVVAVWSGNPAADRRFADKRTEMWWLGAQRIKGNGGVPDLALPNDPELLTELCAPTIEFNNKGCLKLESKDAMKKRGVSSPDVADSLMFTFAETIFADLDIPESTINAVGAAGRGRMKTEYDPFAEA